MIKNELMKLGLDNCKYELMQEKDSIYLFRYSSRKYFFICSFRFALKL
jgi:hypothetical protein